MKYKDRNTLLMQSQYQKEINRSGFPFESDREQRRKRKKFLFEFWSKYLKNNISENFWNALDINEQSSVHSEFRVFDGDKKEFAKMIKLKYHEKLQTARELALKKLGI